MSTKPTVRREMSCDYIDDTITTSGERLVSGVLPMPLPLPRPTPLTRQVSCAAPMAPMASMKISRQVSGSGSKTGTGFQTECECESGSNSKSNQIACPIVEEEDNDNDKDIDCMLNTTCTLDRSIACDMSSGRRPPALVREMTVSACDEIVPITADVPDPVPNPVVVSHVTGTVSVPVPVPVPVVVSDATDPDDTILDSAVLETRTSSNSILKVWIDSGKISVEDAEHMRQVISDDTKIAACTKNESGSESGSGEYKSEDKPRINSFVVEFMRELSDMLVSLASAFDIDEMPTLHSEIKTINDITEYSEQEAYVRDWHAKLSSVYKTIRVGNEEAFLSALTTVDVLNRVHFVSMYTDSGTDAESRAVLLNYISSLNRDAGLFHGLTPSVMEKLDKLSDMCQDPSTMSLQDIMKVAQNTWATLKPEDMREVGTALPSLFDAVGGEHGITSMLHQYGMIPAGMDMGEMLKRGMSMTQSMGNSSIGEIGSSLMSNLSASGLDMGTLASVASSVFGGMTGSSGGSGDGSGSGSSTSS